MIKSTNATAGALTGSQGAVTKCSDNISLLMAKLDQSTDDTEVASLVTELLKERKALDQLGFQMIKDIVNARRDVAQLEPKVIEATEVVDQPERPEAEAMAKVRFETIMRASTPIKAEPANDNPNPSNEGLGKRKRFTLDFDCPGSKSDHGNDEGTIGQGDQTEEGNDGNNDGSSSSDSYDPRLMD